MREKIELLVPAGKWDVLEAVIGAGADAVYLGGKKFNMRLHRSDYHFTDEQLVSAVNFAHKHGVKIYVTINNLLSDSEIDELYMFIEFLQDIGVDAIIVHDLGVIHCVRQKNIKLALHASTMMNTHSVSMAMELKDLGVSRIITSRDITIAQAKEIHEKCNIEVEYFVHGDMCTAQSSQCYSSGVLFAKSSNRGECMKPCRWKYSLVEAETGQPLGEINDGHFLAMNDLCLLQHIPSLVEAGICSFKIEGRMRDAKYLEEVVSIYRRAIDQYSDSPSFYYTDANDLERIYKTRVRNLSTSLSFSVGQSSTFDFSGKREPLFLSRFGREKELTENDLTINHLISGSLNGSKKDHDTQTLNHSKMVRLYDKKLLSIKVGSLEAIKKAVKAGADYIYLNGEVSPIRGQKWTTDLIKEAAEIAHDNGNKLGLCTPRVTTNKEIHDVKMLLEKVKEFKIDSVLVHNLGTLRLARELGFKIIADFSFNVLNTYSASMLKQIGVTMVTSSVESSFENLSYIAANTQIDMECIVHGQIPFMYIEHCLPAMIVTKSGSNGVCRQPCRHINYAIKDEKGEVRPIEVDQYCRNHIFFASDICVLPYLNSFLATDVKSFRIEAQYYNDDLIETVVKLYRKQMDLFSYDLPKNYQMQKNDWNELTEKSPRKFSLGAYKHSIFHSKNTAEVIRSLN